MHTPLEYYIIFPVNLYRAGRKTKAKVDYVRTIPPRDETQKSDVRIYKKFGTDYVDSKSGGVSVFNWRNPSLGSLWWKIPRGTELPDGLILSLDAGGTSGKSHYTVRPTFDMTLSDFIDKLSDLEESAVPCFLGASNRGVG